MTTFPRLCTINLAVLLCLSISSCSQGVHGHGIDLSSPRAAVETYCQGVISSDINAVKNSFYKGEVMEKAYEKPIWTNCVVIEVKETKDIGRYLGDRTKLTSKIGDVEVVKEAVMIDAAKGNPRTRYWYLLRNFDGAWKIISHSHIPDANYPPLD